MKTLALEMIKYYSGDIKRINHFIKVHGYAKAIGEAEGLCEREQNILEAAAYVHDIGIKVSEEKYGSSAGHYQEKEGPPAAEKMLFSLGYDEEFIKRVSYLVGHHHTYSDIDGMDYQILVEADFIVNIYEDGMSAEAVKSVREKVFRTKAGTEILDNLYVMGLDK